MGRSLQVPGSLSSPLTKMYLALADSLGTSSLHAGGEAGATASAKVEALTSLIMSSGVMVSAFWTAL